MFLEICRYSKRLTFPSFNLKFEVRPFEVSGHGVQSPSAPKAILDESWEAKKLFPTPSRARRFRLPGMGFGIVALVTPENERSAVLGWQGGRLGRLSRVPVRAGASNLSLASPREYRPLPPPTDSKRGVGPD